SAYSDRVHYTLDYFLPIGSIQIENGASATNNTAVTLTLNCSDAASGCAWMQFSIDGVIWSDWEAYATSKAWTLSDGDGTKTVSVQYMDGAGNISTSYSDTIALDTIAPSAPPILSPIDGTISNVTSINISGLGAYSSGMVTVYDNGALLGTGQIQGMSVWNFTTGELTEGVHNFTAIVTDGAGNTSAASMSVSYTVDTTAPVITLTGGDVTIEIGSAYTDEGAVATDIVDGEVAVTAVGSVDTNTAGVYTLTYDYTDAAGNAAVQVTRTVTVEDTSNNNGNSSGKGNGGGCTLNSSDEVDPLLPLLLMFSGIYLWRRREC
ncbi:MAG: DUF5011 domain-containing protein, partial [Sphingomonadales bacterium]|nr:DUF5011 domain-containing protein [Sphingomonadales bacterium]